MLLKAIIGDVSIISEKIERSIQGTDNRPRRSSKNDTFPQEWKHQLILAIMHICIESY